MSVIVETPHQGEENMNTNPESYVAPTLEYRGNVVVETLGAGSLSAEGAASSATILKSSSGGTTASGSQTDG
jgi:hypothetical protein